MAARFSETFKVNAVEKVLSRPKDKSIKDIADGLNIGFSTLQKWIRLARTNELESKEPTMSIEQRPDDWTKKQRFEAVLQSHQLSEEELGRYCREKGIYPHHIKRWEAEFLASPPTKEEHSKGSQKELAKENKQLKQELRRKEKALAETAALLVLSKKCQAIWGAEKED
jgi:transposase-like protein